MKITKKPILNILNEHLRVISWKIMAVEEKILPHKKNMTYLIIGLVALVLINCVIADDYLMEFILEAYHMGLITYLFIVIRKPITKKCPHNFNEGKLWKKIKNLILFLWVYTFLITVPILWVTKLFILTTGVNPLYTLAQSDYMKTCIILIITNKPIVIKEHSTEYLKWMYYALLTANAGLAIIVTVGYTIWLKIIKSDLVTKSKLLVVGAKWVGKTILKKKLGPKAFGICSVCAIAITSFIRLHDIIHDQTFCSKLKNKADLQNTLGRELYSSSLFSKDKIILIPPYEKGLITSPKFEGSFFSDHNESAIFNAIAGTPEKSYGFQFVNSNEITREQFQVKIES